MSITSKRNPPTRITYTGDFRNASQRGRTVAVYVHGNQIMLQVEDTTTRTVALTRTLDLEVAPLRIIISDDELNELHANLAGETDAAAVRIAIETIGHMCETAKAA